MRIEDVKIGMEVMTRKSRGHYKQGRVIEISEPPLERARVDWGYNRTWMRVDALQKVSSPYIIPKPQ